MIDPRVIGAVMALLAAGCRSESPSASNDGAGLSTMESRVEPSPGTRARTNVDESYPAASRSSAYTSLKPADCRIVEENAEEAGYSRRNCAGVGGYQVETTESDLRQGLTVIATGGGRTDIPLSATVARGAFNSLGPRGEWRGPTGLAPDTLIVRLNVADGTGAKADISKLVVIRLVPTPCVLAVVGPGPRQNHQARELADTRSGCLGS